MITGIGIDIVDLEVFRRRLGEELIAEIYLPDEIAYCRTQVRSWENFGARLAAKEAVMKALGAGLQQGLRWHDIEIVRRPDGPVSVRLHGAARQLADSRDITAVHISLSHTANSAIAMAVLEKQEAES